MKNLRNKIKNMAGITLVALIITIIVLLILAGVVINMTIGHEGIITKAQGAVDQYKNAQEKENGALGEYENIINSVTGNRDNLITVTEEELKQKIEEALEIKNVTEQYEIVLNDDYIDKSKPYNMQIYKSGKEIQLHGSFFIANAYKGSGEGPTLISGLPKPVTGSVIFNPIYDGIYTIIRAGIVKDKLILPWWEGISISKGQKIFIDVSYLSND